MNILKTLIQFVKKIVLFPINLITKKNKVQIIKPEINKKNAQYMYAAILIFLTLLAVYFFRDFFVLATVNNYPITRLSVVKKLEQLGGKQVLDKLIIENLIKQEAKKQKIVVTDEELKKSLEDIKNQISAQSGVNYEQYLIQNNIREKDILDEIKIWNLTLNKLLADRIKVTDQEVQTHFDTYKEDYYKDKKIEDVKSDITKLLEQQKASEVQEQYIEELKSKANISYFGYAKP